MEDDRPLRKTTHEIGQDLSSLSIEEIDIRIELLNGEIERLNATRQAKQSQRQAAELFFKKS